jgi:Ca2+-binding EF-hand superfamily protein
MRKLLTISALALTTAIGATAVAYGQDAKPSMQTAFWGWGHGDEGRHDGPGRFGRGGQHGPHGDFRRDGGPRAGRMIEAFDANKDGAVTQAEIDQFRQGQITRFDANKDGTLSLDEYQSLWLDQMRERMVDAFQEHDDDGNGQVTSEEFNKRFAGLVERLDRNEDGELSADDRGRGRHGPDGKGSREDAPVPPPPPAAAP